LLASPLAGQSSRGCTLKPHRQFMFKAIIPKAGPETLVPFGGKYVIRTEKITALDGTPPKRFVVIAFDSMEKAKAWKASASSKEVDVIRNKTTKSSQFLVEGM
jgi:uncharacterized protein (DUF1330 family)